MKLFDTISQEEQVSVTVEVPDESSMDSIELEITNLNNSTEEDLENSAGASEEIGEAIEEVQEVGEVQETLETKLEDENYEGMDEVALELLSKKISRIQARYGLNGVSLTNKISKEDFQGESRREATVVACEAMKDWGKNAWTAIKKAWESIKKFFKDLWNKWFGKKKETEAKMDQAAETVKDAPEPTDTELEAPSEIASIYPGNPITADTIIDSAEGLRSVMAAVAMNSSYNRAVAEVGATGNFEVGQIMAKAGELMTSRNLMQMTTTNGKYFTKDSPGIMGYWIADASQEQVAKGEVPINKSPLEKTGRKLELTNGKKTASMLNLVKKAYREVYTIGEYIKDDMDTITQSIEKFAKGESGEKQAKELQDLVKNVSKFTKDFNEVLIAEDRMVAAAVSFANLVSKGSSEETKE